MDRNRLRISSDTGIEIKVHPRRGEIELDPPSPLSPARAPTDYKPFRSWVPWIVPLFVVANIFIFGISMYVNNCPKHSNSCLGRWLGRFSFQTFKENPLLGPSSSTLVKLGALEVDIVVRKHQVWRLISCIWLHAGVFHILANMLSLLLIGIRLEQEFGFVRVGLLYAISGFGGSLLSALFIKNGISVGASGALFGLLGSMLSELITNWTIYANKFYNYCRFTLGLILLFRGVNMNTHCSWCHYLSCIPTSLWKCDSHERYCKMSRLGSQLNMTCQSNWKSNIYQLSDRNPSQAHLQQLCMNLCN